MITHFRLLEEARWPYLLKMAAAKSAPASWFSKVPHRAVVRQVICSLSVTEQELAHELANTTSPRMRGKPMQFNGYTLRLSLDVKTAEIDLFVSVTPHRCTPVDVLSHVVAEVSTGCASGMACETHVDRYTSSTFVSSVRLAMVGQPTDIAS